MWTCPACDRSFSNTGQTHTCRPVGDLEKHFEDVDDVVREVFDEFVSVVRALGPVEVVPQATRIALHSRMSFAALMPRRRWLTGHLVLPEPVDDPRFNKVNSYSKHNHVHQFRLNQPADIDDTMRRWIAEAYQVGLQNHHGQP